MASHRENAADVHGVYEDQRNLLRDVVKRGLVIVLKVYGVRMCQWIVGFCDIGLLGEGRGETEQDQPNRTRESHLIFTLLEH